MLGVGLDQTPHYFKISEKYREANPGTNIGKPGDLTQVSQIHFELKLQEQLSGSKHWGGSVQFGWDACQ